MLVMLPREAGYRHIGQQRVRRDRRAGLAGTRRQAASAATPRPDWPRAGDVPEQPAARTHRRAMAVVKSSLVIRPPPLEPRRSRRPPGRHCGRRRNPVGPQSRRVARHPRDESPHQHEGGRQADDEHHKQDCQGGVGLPEEAVHDLLALPGRPPHPLVGRLVNLLNPAVPFRGSEQFVRRLEHVVDLAGSGRPAPSGPPCTRVTSKGRDPSAVAPPLPASRTGQGACPPS